MLSLHTIHPAKNSQKKRKKIGRGGKRGTYSGKGLKGQKARSGVSGLKRLGMRQLIERTHKLKGFKSRNKKPEILNLNTLNDKFPKGGKITPQILKQKKLIDKIQNKVKILANGEISVKLEIENCKVSKSAKEKIEKAGGSVK
ncbi:50S ribosomal protein L15 [Candidatus Parcubacteria bacterium]|nr:50S ribosomal protein L15 [Patescibacteria group bacterium]MBU4482427.1 50S ribosomal protein L15 [Patescibacteria group bacterium]MCG2686695.1 50S ribosomal protein L15 [Candidatus Parcubacteria bacterium]